MRERTVHVAGEGSPQLCKRCGFAFKQGDEGAEGWKPGARVMVINDPAIKFYEEELIAEGMPTFRLNAVDCEPSIP